jgi:hypothetical protein
MQKKNSKMKLLDFVFTTDCFLQDLQRSVEIRKCSELAWFCSQFLAGKKHVVGTVLANNTHTTFSRQMELSRILSYVGTKVCSRNKLGETSLSVAASYMQSGEAANSYFFLHCGFLNCSRSRSMALYRLLLPNVR